MNYPVLIYDNRCSSCTDYARLVSRILNDRITMIGHYTEKGMEFKRKIFPEGYGGLEMSWFVTESKGIRGQQGTVEADQVRAFGKARRLCRKYI